MICIWSSWCHWHPTDTPSSLAPVNSRMVYLSLCRLTQLVLEKSRQMDVVVIVTNSEEHGLNRTIMHIDSQPHKYIMAKNNGHFSAELIGSHLVCFLHLFQKRTFEDKRHRVYFYGPDVLPVIQPSVSKHWRKHKAQTHQPVVWTPPFFIHHQMENPHTV